MAPSALGLVTGPDVETCAATTAAEIAALVRDGVTVRDRDTGVARPIRPGDVAILFRTRESHREFEDALALAGLPSYVYKGLGFFDADEIKDLLALLWYLAEPASDLRAAAFLRSRFVRLSDEALRRLAPGLADALVRRGGSLDPLREPADPPLDPADQARLAAARASTARWRARADRMPPAELIDLVLQESAYGIELRGARFQQARENLKKFRALLRRIQNRGYATLGRIASHLDRLAVGDESNASLDATNAVNLMTVHAAKGLEFPVVFLVNLARGTGNRRDYIRIGTQQASGTASGAASVAVGDFISEYDDDAQAREREETKRLLYVALTRARDRLYLSSVLKDGRVVAGRGSLADVLPPTLLDCFAAAAAGMPAEWHAGSGHVHSFSVCTRPADGPRHLALSGSPPVETTDDDLDALEAVPSVRRATDVGCAGGCQRAAGGRRGLGVGTCARHRGAPSAPGARHDAAGIRRGRDLGGAAAAASRRSRGPRRSRRVCRAGGRRPIRRCAAIPTFEACMRRPTSCTKCRSRCGRRAWWCAAASTAWCGRRPPRSRCSSSRPDGPAPSTAGRWRSTPRWRPGCSRAPRSPPS